MDGLESGRWEKYSGMGNRWLPTPISFSVQSPRRILDENATVVDLIDQNTKGWKTELIREVFHAEEAQVISKHSFESITTTGPNDIERYYQWYFFCL